MKNRKKKMKIMKWKKISIWKAKIMKYNRENEINESNGEENNVIERNNGNEMKMA